MKVLSSVKIGQKHLDLLQREFPQVQFHVFPSVEEAASHLTGAEVLLTYGSDFGVEELEKAQQLRWIQVLAAGVEQLPLSALRKRKILVTNARGVHAIPMAEYVLGVMLNHVRQLDRLFTSQRRNVWDREVRFTELHGQTLGLVGVGAIGSQIARYARVFGMKVVGINRSGGESPFVDELYPVSRMEEALPRLNFLVLIVPATPETRHLIGRRELELLPPDAVVINVARGSVLDEEALLQLLQQGRLGGAYLDVFQEEPLPPEHPFWRMENVWITPHSAGLSPNYMRRCMEIFRHNLRAYLTHQALTNVVDLTRGY